MKTCPDCGSRVFRLGCVNCDEENYIQEQEQLTDLQYPDTPTSRAEQPVTVPAADCQPPIYLADMSRPTF